MSGPKEQSYLTADEVTAILWRSRILLRDFSAGAKEKALKCAQEYVENKQAE